MNWNKRKHTLSIMSAQDYKGEDATYVELKLELNYQSYECIYILPHDKEEEPYLEVVSHGEEEYWCRFCHQQSTSTPICQALTNDKEFDAVLTEKMDDYMDQIQWNATEGYLYEELEYDEFQALVYPFILTYDKQHDCFHAGFALGDEDEIDSPYLLLGVNYTCTPKGDFSFDLKRSVISHYEGGIRVNNKQLLNFVCDCGYEYDIERSKRQRHPVSCNMFRDYHYFKEWAWEIITQTEGFLERVTTCLEESNASEIPSIKKSKTVSLDEYKKQKK